MGRRKNKKPGLIAGNPRARHDYFIEKTYEAGISLLGWEVKSLRAGRLSLKGSFVQMKVGEAFLMAANISPLNTCPSYLEPDVTRIRKLLLKKHELKHLESDLQLRGYALVPLSAYWRNNLVKLELALGKGKKLYDKRATERERDWQREKALLRKRDIRFK